MYWRATLTPDPPLLSFSPTLVPSPPSSRSGPPLEGKSAAPKTWARMNPPPPALPWQKEDGEEKVDRERWGGRPRRPKEEEGEDPPVQRPSQPQCGSCQGREERREAKREGGVYMIMVAATYDQNRSLSPHLQSLHIRTRCLPLPPSRPRP